MGMYTGCAFRLPLKKDAPAEIQEFMDTCFYAGDPETAFRNLVVFLGDGPDYGDVLDVLLEDLHSMLNGYSSFFESWYWRVKEDHDAFYLYETRGSCKYPCLEAFSVLLNTLHPWLDVKDGDIVFRSIYEESLQEYVIYLDDGEFKLDKTKGYRYSDFYGSNHPRKQKTGRDYMTFDYNTVRHQRIEDDTPPWTIAEIAALKAKKDDSESYWGY